jgi:hypothetical protein
MWDFPGDVFLHPASSVMNILCLIFIFIVEKKTFLFFFVFVKVLSHEVTLRGLSLHSEEQLSNVICHLSFYFIGKRRAYPVNSITG